MKKVHWDNSLVEPIIKRVCDCQGCGKCIDPLINTHIFCKTFGQFKCDTCNEWRCKKCIFNWTCRYCKRI
jgi:hypothetical protein